MGTLIWKRSEIQLHDACMVVKVKGISLQVFTVHVLQIISFVGAAVTFTGISIKHNASYVYYIHVSICTALKMVFKRPVLTCPALRQLLC